MRSRHVLVALALLGATACGSAAAAPTRAPVSAAAVAPLASVRIVEDLAAREAAMVPSVVGTSVEDARRALPDLSVNVVVVGRAKDRVSAQWPPPGDPLPGDGVVVVWVGKPPAAEPAPATATRRAPAPPPVPLAAPPAVPAPAPAAATAPGSGVTPGLEGFVAPPHPPRANIRTMPPAKPGTALQGRASWYGPGFAGRGTACGTTFDPTALTLASRELRCGTKVTVTAASGRSVRATVTDWGPAEWTDRRFDLSQATFSAVAGLGAGVIDVTVTVD